MEEVTDSTGVAVINGVIDGEGLDMIDASGVNVTARDTDALELEEAFWLELEDMLELSETLGLEDARRLAVSIGLDDIVGINDTLELGLEESIELGDMSSDTATLGVDERIGNADSVCIGEADGLWESDREYDADSVCIGEAEGLWESDREYDATLYETDTVYDVDGLYDISDDTTVEYDIPGDTDTR